jgi:Fe2+ or Zn2+ uptake regulation protein
VAVPALRLPSGFRLEGLEISVQGWCPRCRGAA